MIYGENSGGGYGTSSRGMAPGQDFDLGAKLNQFGNWANDTLKGAGDWLGINPREVNAGAFQLPGQVTMNTGPQDQFRQQQWDLGQLLAQRANGTGGPSPAELLMKQGTDRSMAQAVALAQMQRGPGAAAAARNAAYNQGNIAQQGVANASTLRAQEQLEAQNMLGQLLAGARGQDIGVAGKQADLDLGQILAQLQANMAMEGMSADAWEKATGTRRDLIGSILQGLGTLSMPKPGG